MKIEITASPVFRLPLTQADVALLRELAAAHYDGRCKAAGAVGGFLYGWSNMWVGLEGEEDISAVRVSGSMDQIDTTLKILELRGSGILHGRDDDLSLMTELDKALRNAMDHWKEISPTWRTYAETVNSRLVPSSPKAVSADQKPREGPFAFEMWIDSPLDIKIVNGELIVTCFNVAGRDQTIAISQHFTKAATGSLIGGIAKGLEDGTIVISKAENAPRPN